VRDWIDTNSDWLSLVGVVFTILAVIIVPIGWLIKKAIEKKVNKINLRFEIVQDPDVPVIFKPDDFSKAEYLLTKTSPSGYCLRVHNNGSVPVYYDHFELSLGKRKNYYTILSWLIEDNLDPVRPHQDKMHVMDQQDFIQLLRVCEKKRIQKCNIEVWPEYIPRAKAKKETQGFNFDDKPDRGLKRLRPLCVEVLELSGFQQSVKYSFYSMEPTRTWRNR